jgi:hypothetical protein
MTTTSTKPHTFFKVLVVTVADEVLVSGAVQVVERERCWNGAEIRPEEYLFNACGSMF